jgi:hypothetical protein
MAEDTLRDTVPAPPVPSTNPTADLRRKLEQGYAGVREDANAVGPVRFVCMKRIESIFYDVSPRVTKETAYAWLTAARLALTDGTMEPEFCQKGHLKVTHGLCGTCLTGGR